MYHILHTIYGQAAHAVRGPAAWVLLHSAATLTARGETGGQLEKDKGDVQCAGGTPGGGVAQVGVGGDSPLPPPPGPPHTPHAAKQPPQGTYGWGRHGTSSNMARSYNAWAQSRAHCTTRHAAQQHGYGLPAWPPAGCCLLAAGPPLVRTRFGPFLTSDDGLAQPWAKTMTRPRVAAGCRLPAGTSTRRALPPRSSAAPAPPRPAATCLPAYLLPSSRPCHNGGSNMPTVSARRICARRAEGR